MMLIIDNYDSFTYNIYQMLAVHTPDIDIYRNDKISLDDIAALSPKGIILSPGPGRPEDAGICVDIIHKFSEKIPILGICLGHQAIGHAFGASIIHAPKVIHGKTSPIYHQELHLYHHIPSPFDVGRYHSLIIDSKTLPDCLTVTANTDDNIVMGVQHKQYPLFGVQYHPESILSSHGDQLLKNFICISKERKTHEGYNQ